MSHELLDRWRAFRLGRPPHIFPGDEVLLRREISERWIFPASNWKEYLAKDFPSLSDKRLHLALIPRPFAGRLESASIVILTLNPGLNPVDYYAEYTVPQYRRALRRELKQANGPTVFLNPRFSWHSGFMYWYRKLKGLISSFEKRHAIGPRKALNFFATRVAVLELVPYHSASFGLPNRILGELSSVRLAQRYVSQVLLPLARAGKITLIVARAGARWNLHNRRGVVVYNRGETRAAHLTASSRGGKVIAHALDAAWRDHAI